MGRFRKSTFEPEKRNTIGKISKQLFGGIPFEIASPQPEITRENGLRAFHALREEARANGVQELTLDEINAEIRQVREGLA